MKVTAITPADAAASPSHPDHDRWVKETTLTMEVAHAQRLGGTLRDAERENARLLARMDALAKAEKPKKPTAPRKSRQQRMLERAVSVRAALPPKKLTLNPSPCGRCGVCRACMRERRILAISQMATQQKDPWALRVMWDLTLHLLNVNARSGKFKGLSKADADRSVTAKAEAVCDESVRRMGEWRR